MDFSFEEIIGRPEVLNSDPSNLVEYFSDKTILVTGAGGSIGSEITRQLAAVGIQTFVALDRDENSLHRLQLSIGSSALFDDSRFVLCDIKSDLSLEAVFREYRPDVVIHAAALKHLSALERFPLEAYFTNAKGTLNVLEKAKAFGVNRFINISTDKAADPSSILGKTKRIAELLTAYFDRNSAMISNSVRFGNVFASRGSVIETFTSQIVDGAPLTLTDLNVKRYFMSVFEAAQLVLQTGPLKSSSIYLLKMGEAVFLADIAKNLMKKLGKTVPILVTGLRPGEKINEDLLSKNETVVDAEIPQVSQIVQTNWLLPLSLESFSPNDNEEARQKIDQLLKDAGEL